MSYNKTNMYDIEQHIAEIYDEQEDYTDDVELIRQLIGEGKSLSILEPFCGTGRISIPLALDGHNITGFDQAEVMLKRARSKIKKLPEKVHSRINLYKRDVAAGDWPIDYDLVILGGNCLYELALPEEQEKCIRFAATSLKSGGYVYIDNDHMEGELAPSWQQYSINTEAFPTGTCQDGTRLESEVKRIWYDVAKRLVRYRRRTKIILPDGEEMEEEYLM